jgi:SAM-dependent methyltransferase
MYFRRKKLPKWFFETVVTVLMLPVFPFYLLEKAVVNIDNTWFWAPLAALRGYLYCLRQRPEIIYSTGGPACAHLAAGWIAGWTGIPWVAELQDPLVHSYCARSGEELRLVHWAERFLCRKANRVVFLTEGAARAAAGRTQLADRGVCIYPGAKPIPEAPAAIGKGEVLRIVHIGSLGGVRNLAFFLKGLEAALVQRPGIDGTLQVHLYGSLQKDILSQIDASVCRGMFTLHGQVSRERAAYEMLHSDLLLLIQGADDVSSETIPSKAYEYFQARRPVLGLVYKNTELWCMLERLGHRPAWADAPGEIKEAILHFVCRWEGNTLTRATEPSSFTVESAVAQLAGLPALCVYRRGDESRREGGGRRESDEPDPHFPGVENAFDPPPNADRVRESPVMSPSQTSGVDWKAFYQKHQPTDLQALLRGPSEWQLHLAEQVRDAVAGGSLLEAGCGLGLTTFLVGGEARRFLMDREQSAVGMARALFATGGQEAFYACGDLLRMPFPDEVFDVVYNAGVLEHFDLPDRKAALLEMLRVTRTGGRVITAIPNHYSTPYRYAYLLKKRRGTWPYPDENKIYDFTEELAGVRTARCLGRQTVCRKTAFSFLRRHLRIIFHLLDWFLRFEGYLTVLTYEKLPVDAPE